MVSNKVFRCLLLVGAIAFTVNFCENRPRSVNIEVLPAGAVLRYRADFDADL